MDVTFVKQNVSRATCVSLVLFDFFCMTFYVTSASEYREILRFQVTIYMIKRPFIGFTDVTKDDICIELPFSFARLCFISGNFHKSPFLRFP